jgi:hypothetical protein
MIMRTFLARDLVFVVAMTAGVSADLPSAGAKAGSTPMIEVHARTMKREGGVAQSGTANGSFVPGSPETLSVNAGTTHPEEMTLCGGGVGGDRPIADMLKSSSFVWKLTTRPTKYENGRGTFDLEWARYRADSGDRAVAQGSSTLTLAEGQRQAVDFVRGAPGSGSCTAESTLIEVAVAVREDQKLAQTILQYDLWLTHRSPDGEQKVRHFVGMGAQGAEVAFAFVPLRFGVPQVVSNQQPYDLITSVLGKLRGRVTPDGRITLAVDTTRNDGMGPPGEPASGYGGGSGSKYLEMAEGEAIEIELPAASGRSSRPAFAGVIPPPRAGAPDRVTEPVSVRDGRVIVDESLFFQGHRTSLVVQIRRVG